MMMPLKELIVRLFIIILQDILLKTDNLEIIMPHMPQAIGLWGQSDSYILPLKIKFGIEPPFISNLPNLTVAVLAPYTVGSKWTPSRMILLYMTSGVNESGVLITEEAA